MECGEQDPGSYLSGHTGCVNSVCMSHDGRFIISGSLDTTVRIWSLANKTQEAVLTGHTDFVNSVYESR
jgi:WD40 repeat protein